jgi:hypothetical protein
MIIRIQNIKGVFWIKAIIKHEMEIEKIDRTDF